MTRIAYIFSLAALLIICFLFGCGRNPVGTKSEASIYDLEVRPASTKATISWKTDIATVSEIEYGPRLNYSYQAKDEGTVRFKHALEITGLIPETEYFFRIVGGEATGFSFVTSSEGLTLKIDPCLKQVQVGETFLLDIWVEKVSHLSEVGLRFHFDPAVLEGLGISFGEFLGDNILSLPNTYDLKEGIMGIGMAIKRIKPGGERKEVSGSGIVARLSFSARVAGETEIIIDRDKKVLALKKQDGRSSVDGFDHLFLGSAQVIVNP
ncbi:MAG: hypothetical protein AB1797_08845 [bacterium]